jgi:hypothetical protein
MKGETQDGPDKDESRIREKNEEPPRSANPGKPVQEKATPATDPARIRTHIHMQQMLSETSESHDKKITKIPTKGG